MAQTINNPMTADQARARRTQLLGWATFRQRLAEGDPEANDEIDQLIRIIVDEADRLAEAP